MIVLIVDDEPMSRRVLRRLLSRFPELDLREAENGEAAWTMIGDRPPGLILCDLIMPVMDGVTLIRQLRSHETWRHIPVIVASASKDRERLVQVRDLQVSDYLLKPFDLVQTFARLEKQIVPLLQRFRAEKAAALEAERAAARVASETPAEPPRLFTPPDGPAAAPSPAP